MLRISFRSRGIAYQPECPTPTYLPHDHTQQRQRRLDAMKSGLIDPRATVAAAIACGLLTPAPKADVCTETLLRRKRGYRTTSHRAPTSPPESAINGPQGAVRNQSGVSLPTPMERALIECRAHAPLKYGELSRIASHHSLSPRVLRNRLNGVTKKSRT